MRIVLTEDVVGVGDIGETVNVRPGFARNYLVPRGLAIELGQLECEAARTPNVANRSKKTPIEKRY